MPTELREKLKRQGYHLLGQRGAFKACQWQKKSLLHGDVCYKERFYGIESHRCLQMTPVVDKCTQSCDFCWRVTPSDIGMMWNQTSVAESGVLAPSDLLDEVMMANLRSLGGYHPKIATSVTEKRYYEAREPRHLAISLAGEPTLYPFLSELIEEGGNRGMTTFLVTNGTRPDVLADITPPTQLYVTLSAPDEQTYRALCKPIVSDGWKLLNESQETLHSLSCRTVNRLTMVAGRNMHEPRSFAKLILSGEPDFVEVKGYMFLGSSRGRMSNVNAPSHREIRAFSKKLSALTGYYLQEEQVESRVVLLSRSKDIKKIQ
ncbi:MAG: 4-demethylwyosine synthase TYW1 [Candidatus Thorarchaeota archaeon]|nr:MAG: 4-demethylwyosine synthase TYW1 [Candidatus Thorarchaeota archaeon]